MEGTIRNGRPDPPALDRARSTRSIEVGIFQLRMVPREQARGGRRRLHRRRDQDRGRRQGRRHGRRAPASIVEAAARLQADEADGLLRALPGRHATTT